VTRVLGSFSVWVACLVAVAATALVLAPSTPKDVQRIAHLESIVRCPACEDLSVAQSNAPSSLAVRHEIVRRVREGQSDTRILTSLEARYGTAVLLAPRAGGLGYLLWAVPVGVFVVGAALYGRLVRRRR
jgi:cytochrome c-type biogenesis protein CcmH/NrfF